MLLEVKGLSVYYEKALALDEINIEVGEGEFVAIIGPNGAGKTTLLRSISGLVRPVGQILFDGNRIDDLPAHKIVKMGVVHCPERRRPLPEMSIFENLLCGAYLRKDKPEISNDLKGVFELFPILEERKNQLAGTLSGGEQQMLAIGRSLMSKPKLLMLDEPSLGLAPIIVEKIFESIGEIRKRGVTIVLVEQDVGLALSISDRGYVLEGGRLVMEGISKELLSNKEIRKVYLGVT